MISPHHPPAETSPDRWCPRVAPPLVPAQLEVVGKVHQLMARTRARLVPTPDWGPSLRRVCLARVVRGSASLSGYEASLDDALAVVDGAAGADDRPGGSTLSGIRDCLRGALQLGMEDDLEAGPTLVRALHYMALGGDARSRPGRWRRAGSPRPAAWPAPSSPRPEAASMGDAVAEVMTRADEASTTPLIVRAGLAHLNLLLLSPFDSGNGRVARAVHTMLVAREFPPLGVLAAIDECLGARVSGYRSAFQAELGGIAGLPGRRSPWIEMCLRTHLAHSEAGLERIEAAERIWTTARLLVERRGVSLRSVAGLWDAAVGLRVRNGSYRGAVGAWTGESLSYQSASRDLKALVDARLLDAHGETSNRWYSASEALADAGPTA
jgi:hypothetical protein